MNLKHGYYSNNCTINPDSLMLRTAILRSKQLATLTGLFDDNRLNVGHLYTVSSMNDESIKDYFWGLCGEVEKCFEIDSDQAKYANLAGLLTSAIVEFEIDTGKIISDMIIRSPENWKHTKQDLHLDSIVSKMVKLRTRF